MVTLNDLEGKKLHMSQRSCECVTCPLLCGIPTGDWSRIENYITCIHILHTYTHTSHMHIHPLSSADAWTELIKIHIFYKTQWNVTCLPAQQVNNAPFKIIQSQLILIIIILNGPLSPSPLWLISRSKTSISFNWNLIAQFDTHLILAAGNKCAIYQ